MVTMTMKAKDPTISLEALKSLVHYCPETGHFTRVKRLAQKHKVGDRADFLHGGYMKVCLPGSRVRAHRLAWFYMTGEWPAEDIDHKNRDRTDNRWENLRQASRSQNLSNRAFGPDRGVNWLPDRKKWAAKVKHAGKMHQKRFDSKEKALEWVRAKRLELFGPDFS